MNCVCFSALPMKTFYATTPIYYVNDLPHIGHIYSTVVTDVMTRYHRLARREDALPDRHRRARAEHREGRGGPGDRRRSSSPTGSSERYHELYKTFEIRNDDFIRTTEERHRRGVEALIARIEAAGDLYTTDTRAGTAPAARPSTRRRSSTTRSAVPSTEKPAAWESEDNVFFRLSKYAEPLLDLYAQPSRVRPPGEPPGGGRSSFVEARAERPVGVALEREAGASRFPGIPGHVVYVWLDALSNYITALGFGRTGRLALPRVLGAAGRPSAST